jgi:hypothetical protein
MRAERRVARRPGARRRGGAARAAGARRAHVRPGQPALGGQTVTIDQLARVRSARGRSSPRRLRAVPHQRRSPAARSRRAETRRPRRRVHCAGKECASVWLGGLTVTLDHRHGRFARGRSSPRPSPRGCPTNLRTIRSFVAHPSPRRPGSNHAASRTAQAPLTHSVTSAVRRPEKPPHGTRLPRPRCAAAVGRRARPRARRVHRSCAAGAARTSRSASRSSTAPAPPLPSRTWSSSRPVDGGLSSRHPRDPGT